MANCARQYIGRVVGTKMTKTARVSVTMSFLHPIVLKYVPKRKTYFAHDEDSACRLGDLVMIKEAKKKYSKNKHFFVSEILERAETFTNPETGETFSQPLK